MEFKKLISKKFESNFIVSLMKSNISTVYSHKGHYVGSEVYMGLRNVPNIAWELKLVNENPSWSCRAVTRTTEPHTSITEAHEPRARAPQQEKPLQCEAIVVHLESSPSLPQLEKDCMQQRRPSTAKNKFKIKCLKNNKAERSPSSQFPDLLDKNCHII